MKLKTEKKSNRKRKMKWKERIQANAVPSGN